MATIISFVIDGNDKNQKVTHLVRTIRRKVSVPWSWNLSVGMRINHCCHSFQPILNMETNHSFENHQTVISSFASVLMHGTQFAVSLSIITHSIVQWMNVVLTIDPSPKTYSSFVFTDHRCRGKRIRIRSLWNIYVKSISQTQKTTPDFIAMAETHWERTYLEIMKLSQWK